MKEAKEDPPGQFTGPPDAALCCDLSGGHWSLAVTDNPAFHSTHSSTETELKSPLWQTTALTFALSDCISHPFFSSSLSLSLSFLTALHDHVSRIELVEWAYWSSLSLSARGLILYRAAVDLCFPQKSALSTPNFRYRFGKFLICSLILALVYFSG